ILLCRRHHLVFHNNGWEIHRDDATYYLTPPRNIDPEQKPIRLVSRNPDLHNRNGT
ncbi:MAG TPA: HNH nuclease, partial [Microbacteriaceae bacterium]|nr:HNH nuclease [Microbacteriaceae bacterium]